MHKECKKENDQNKRTNSARRKIRKEKNYLKKINRNCKEREDNDYCQQFFYCHKSLSRYCSDSFNNEFWTPRGSRWPSLT